MNTEPPKHDNELSEKIRNAVLPPRGSGVGSWAFTGSLYASMGAFFFVAAGVAVIALLFVAFVLFKVLPLWIWAIPLVGALFAVYYGKTEAPFEPEPSGNESWPHRPDGVLGSGGFAYHSEMYARDILNADFDQERAFKGIYLQQFIGQYGEETNVSLYPVGALPDGQNLCTVDNISRDYNVWADAGAPWMTTRNAYEAPFHLTYRGEAHGITIAGTRYGKGTGSIIPTLLMTTESFFVLDVKGENWSVTVKNRTANGYTVRLLNPFQLWRDELGFTPYQSTVQFNPLAKLKADNDRFGEIVRGLAQAIIYERGISDDDHFTDRARDLVACLLAYVATDKTEIANGKNNIPRIREIMAQPVEQFCNFMAGIAASSDVLIVKNSAAAFAPEKPSEAREVQSIISTAAGRLAFLDNPKINHFLSGDDFDFSELRNPRTAVYFIMSPDELLHFPNLARLIVQSCINALWRPVKTGDASVLLVLDELYQLGKLDIIKKAYGIMAGYKVRLWAIFQNLSNFKKVYGDDWESIIGGAGFVHLLGTNEMETAEYFSRRVGKSTMQITGTSSGFSTSQSGTSRSENWSVATQAVDAVTPQYLMEMHKHETDKRGLLFVSGESHPAMTTNIPYYKTAPIVAYDWQGYSLPFPYGRRAGFSLPFPYGRPVNVLPNAAREEDHDEAIAALKEFFATKERLEREHEAQQSPALEDNADNGAFGSAFEKRRAKQKADKVIFSAWDELRDKFHFNPGHTELKIDDYVYLVAETIKTDSDKERYHDLLEIVMPEVYEAMFGLPPYRDTPHGLNGSGKSEIRP